MKNSISTEKEVPALTNQVAAVFGHVDGVEAGTVKGWVVNKLDIENRCTVVALSQGQVISEVCADLYREDLLSHGIGDGRHAFHLPIPILEVGGEIEIMEKLTGTKLVGSPVKVEVAAALVVDYEKSAASDPSVGVLGEVAAGSDMDWQSNAEAVTARVLVSSHPGREKRNSIKEPALVKRDSAAGMNQKQPGQKIESQFRGERGQPASKAGEPVDLASAINDVISKIRSRNNLHEKASTLGEVNISLAEVYRLSDAEAVFFAYKTILGRVPDPDGYRTYVSALRSGSMSRVRLLEVLRDSQKVKHSRIRILHDAAERDLVESTRQTKPTRILYNAEDFGIKDLAGKEDTDSFLTRAYRLVLKRDPDPNGIAAYREVMENGTTYAQVLMSMIDSEEFKQRSEPFVILGVTSTQDVLKTLLTAAESMMTTIIELEYQLQTIKNA